MTANIGVASGNGPINGTVILNGPATLSGVVLGNGATGGLIVSAPANTLVADIFVGNTFGGVGNLQISNGGVVSSPIVGYIGVLAGSKGTATVTGSGASWSTGPSLYVGDYGNGNLNVVNGGAVTSSDRAWIGYQPGSVGAVTVDGTGSTWTIGKFLEVGSFSQGSLNITGGGVVNTGAGVTIGSTSGSSGSVVVSGAHSQLNVGAGGSNLGVGAAGFGNPGDGSLTIQAGGVVNSGLVNGFGAVIGGGGTGRAIITGSGSTWNTGSFLFVGGGNPKFPGGNGTATITTGGVVNTAGIAYVGIFGSRGVVTVSDAGSELNATGISVGYSSGQGTLNALNSGAIHTAFADVGASAQSSGSVLVDAASWTNTGSFVVGGGGIGSVKIRNGGHLTTGSMTVAANGTLDVDPAIVTVANDFVLMKGGTLSLGIFGSTTNLVSQLMIGGTGLFQGDIFISFMNGFSPRAGDTFDLISAVGGADFSQANIDILGVSPGFQYADAFANGTWTLTALTNGIVSPEPSSLVLLGTGLITMFGAGLRIRARRSSPFDRHGLS